MRRLCPFEMISVVYTPCCVRVSTQYALRIITLSLLMTLSAACARMTPEQQQAQGEALYQAYCASCHEIDQGIGPRLTEEVLATRVTAMALFVYNQKNMPYNAGNTLQEDEYWAITAYLLAREGFLEKDRVLDAETAEGLTLDP